MGFFAFGWGRDFPKFSRMGGSPLHPPLSYLPRRTLFPFLIIEKICGWSLKYFFSFKITQIYYSFESHSQYLLLNYHGNVWTMVTTLKEETFWFLAEFAKVNSRKKLGKLSCTKVYSRKKFEIYQPQKKVYSRKKMITLLAWFFFLCISIITEECGLK